MAFYGLANLADLYDGFSAAHNINGKALLLLQEGGEIFVIENRCPHMDAPLASGQVKDGAIICRAHGIGFDLRTGRARGPLSGMLDCLRFFPASYQGNKVGVEL